MGNDNPKIDATKVKWDTPKIDPNRPLVVKKENPVNGAVDGLKAQGGVSKDDADSKQLDDAANSITGDDKGLVNQRGEVIHPAPVDGSVDAFQFDLPPKDKSQGDIYTPRDMLSPDVIQKKADIAKQAAESRTQMASLPITGDVRELTFSSDALKYLQQFDPKNYAGTTAKIKAGTLTEPEAFNLESQGIAMNVDALQKKIGELQPYVTEKNTELQKLSDDLSTDAKALDEKKKAATTPEAIQEYNDSAAVYNLKLKDLQLKQSELQTDSKITSYQQLYDTYNKTSSYSDALLDKYPEVKTQIAKQREADLKDNMPALPGQLPNPMTALKTFYNGVADLKMDMMFRVPSELLQSMGIGNSETWDKVIAAENASLENEKFAIPKSKMLFNPETGDIQGAGIIPAFAGIIPTIASFVVGGGAVTEGLSALGMARTSAQALSIPIANTVIGYNSAYQEGRKAGLSPKDANAYAMQSGMINGILFSQLPLLKQLKTSAVASEQVKAGAEEVALQLKNDAGIKQALDNGVKAFTKGSMAALENAGVMTSTEFGNKLAQTMQNVAHGKTFDTNVDPDEVIKNFIANTLTFAPFSLPEVFNHMRDGNELLKYSFYMAGQHPEEITNAINDAYAKGTITDTQQKRALDIVTRSSEALAKVKPDASEELKQNIIPLIAEQNSLEEQKKELHSSFSKPLSEQQKVLQQQIDEKVNPKTETNATDTGEKQSSPQQQRGGTDELLQGEGDIKQGEDNTTQQETRLGDSERNSLLSGEKKPEVKSEEKSQKNINLADNERESELAQSRLTEADNAEQEPGITAIESKAEGADKTKLAEAATEAGAKLDEATGVGNFPVKDISTDTEKYQGRKEPFSKRSVEKIKGGFDENKLDPIVLYKAADGKTYVLSGHSRLEAHRQLGKQTVKARFFEGTPEEAKKFALESNKLTTLQTDLENAAYYRKQLKEGKSYNAVLTQAKENEQAGAATRTVNLAHLSPEGKTIRALEALESKEGESTANASQIANRIGELRAFNPHLTDAHENELFDWFSKQDSVPSKETVEKEIGSSINVTKFNPEEPLNLKKNIYKTPQREDWEQERDALKSEVSDLKKSTTPNKETGWTPIKEEMIAKLATDKSKEAIDQAEKDFESNKNGVKDLYEKKLSDAKELLKKKQDDLAKNLLSEKDLIQGEKAQTSLFDQPRTASDIQKDIERSRTTPVRGLLDDIEKLPDGKEKDQLFNDYTKANVERVSKQQEEVKKSLEEETSPALPKGDEVIYESSFLPKTVKEKISAFLKKQMTSIGDLPQVVFDRKIEMEGMVRAHMNRLKRTVGDFRATARKAYKGNPTEAQLKDIDDALKSFIPGTNNTALQGIPVELHPLIAEMRNNIDNLTNEMINTGAIQGDLVNIVTANLGVYLTRSYRKFDDPEWINKVPEQVINKAKNYIINSYSNAGVVLTHAELQGLIDHLLYVEDAPMAILKGSKLGSKDLGILKKKDDIPEEIRALMGEYSDPILNYSRSLFKMVNIIEKTKFLNDVKTAGMNTFLFDKPIGKHIVKIAADGSNPMAPLNGLYTTPEIKAAFEEFSGSKNLPEWYRVWLTINGVAKYGKTIGSPQSQIRNFISNIGIMMANGHFDLSKAGDAFSGIITDFNLLKGDAQREKLNHYIELGIVGESVMGGEFRDVVKDATIHNDNLSEFYNKRVKKFASNTIDAPAKVYAANDDFFKIYAFENELAQYKKAFPNKPIEELEKDVGEIVRNTVPTYSMVPKLIKSLRRFPLLGSFVSWPAEIARTTYHIYAQALAEIKAPETRTIGIKRMASAIAVMGSTFGIVALNRYLNNIDDQQEDSMRTFMPPWNKNSQLLFIGKDNNGNFKYVDLSYTDPYNFLKKGFIAAANGTDLNDAMKDALSEYAQPFFSEEIFTSKLLDLARNQTVDGRPIYNPQSDDRFMDMANHLWEGIEPGAITSAKRIYRGVQGQVSPGGRSYDANTETIALVSGQRISTLNIPQSFSFKARKFAEDREQAKKIYNEVRYNKGTITPSQLDDAYNEANQSYQKLFSEFNKTVNDAQKLGMTASDIKTAFKQAGLAQHDWNHLISGKFVGFKRDDKP